jgi:DNA-binding transcriptional LysR family regulator
MKSRHGSTNIPIEALRSFVSIIDTGSFTKAATQLNLTQPGISAQMKRIQELIGEELFQREQVGLSITEKGEAVCRYARRMVALNDRIIQSSRPIKRWRVGLPSIFANHSLEQLRDVLCAHNLASTQIAFGDSLHLRRELDMGQLDAALLLHRTEAELTSDYQWQEPLAWVCHPQFVLSPGAAVPLINWFNSLQDQIVVTACDHADVRYSVEFVSDQFSALMEATNLRLGYVCLTERRVPHGLKIAKDYYLPKLPPMRAGIFRNIDALDRDVNTILDCLAAVFLPR